MPEATETDASAEAAPKKKRKLILILPVLLLVIAGGVSAFFYLRPVAGKTEAAKSEKSANSKDKKKAKTADEDAEDAEETAKSGEKSKSGSSESLKSILPEDEEVKQVVELQPFVVNLADTEQARYLRLTVSVGVGEGSEKPDSLFITRVRNAMLEVLSGKKSDEILTNEGKKSLRKELLHAAQAASEEPEVQAIYITDFIVQL